MTKADLVEKVTRLGDLTRRDGEVIVETLEGAARPGKPRRGCQSLLNLRRETSLRASNRLNHTPANARLSGTIPAPGIACDA